MTLLSQHTSSVKKTIGKQVVNRGKLKEKCQEFVDS